jgi:hypothetical protein
MSRSKEEYFSDENRRAMADKAARLMLAGLGHADVGPADLPTAVGIVGRIGAGKTTAAHALCTHLGYQRLSFAAPLKEVCWHVYGPLGVPYSAFYGTQEEKAEIIPGLGVSGRKLLEHIGTEGFRGVTPDVWARAALASMNKGFRYVIDDVRYPNEAAALKKIGIVIRLERLDYEAPRTGHASDNAIDELPVTSTLSMRTSGVPALQQAIVAHVVRAAVLKMEAA